MPGQLHVDFDRHRDLHDVPVIAEHRTIRDRERARRAGIDMHIPQLEAEPGCRSRHAGALRLEPEPGLFLLIRGCWDPETGETILMWRVPTLKVKDP